SARTAEGSGEPNHEPTNRNRIGGVADQGERAFDREALATKGKRINPAAVWGTALDLTWGDLALRLKGRRRKTVRAVSRGRTSPTEPPEAGSAREAKGRTERRARRS